MRRLGLIATIPVAAMLFAGTVAAQDAATPAADGGGDGSARSINAKACNGDAVAADALVAAASAQPEASGFQIQVPLGDPVTPETRAAVSDTVRGFLACLNANDPLRAANFLTDAGKAAVYGGNFASEEATKAFKDALAKTPEARTQDEAIRLFAITDVADAGNGYLAALVAFSNPIAPPRGPQTVLFVMKDEGGTPKIDSLVGFSKPVTQQATPAASS